MPFPTVFLAEHFEHRIAAVLYSGTFVFLAIVFNLLWRCAAKGHQMLYRNVDHEAVAAITKQYAVGPMRYLACFGLAFVNVMASVGLNIARALWFALEPQRALLLRHPIQHFRWGEP